MLGTALARLLEGRNLRSPRQAGLVLMYHGIGPGSGDPGRDLVPQLDHDLFRAQLVYLTRRYEIVPLKDLRERIARRGRSDRLPVALTFDDDLKTHSLYATALLAEVGVPGTFFLSGVSLHGTRSSWWQDLQAVFDRGGEEWTELVSDLEIDAPCTGIRSLAQAIESMAPADRDRAGERIRARAGSATDRPLSADEIQRIASSGFEVGFHTRRHYNLMAVSDYQLRQTLTEGLDEIQALTGYRPTTIAYPHCCADRRVAEAARNAGFDLGLICGGAAVTPSDHPMLMDRIDGWSKSVGHFALRLARAVQAATGLDPDRTAE